MENKKFANSKLNDQELEGVAGGSAGTTAEDSRFLNVLLAGKPSQCDRYGAARIRLEDHDSEIADAWKSVGVDATIHSGGPISSGRANTYKINGKEVSHYEAMQHAMNVVGKQMSREDWNW